MKKYWHVIGIGIQNNLTYRFNYLTRTLFSFIPLFAMLSLWRTIYAGKGSGGARIPAGHTGGDDFLLHARRGGGRAHGGQRGRLADRRRHPRGQHQPVPAQADGLSVVSAVPVFFRPRGVYLMARMPLAIFIFCFRDQYFLLPAKCGTAAAFFFHFADADGAAAIFSFLRDGDARVLGAGNLHVSFSSCSPLNTSPADTCFRSISVAARASTTPLFTPFPYQMYFPVAIYMGKISGADLWSGPARAIPLGAGSRMRRALHVAARREEILGVRRMNRKHRVCHRTGMSCAKAIAVIA
jgi:hypothetical protein